MLQEELWSIRLAVSSSLQPTTSHQLWGTLYSQIEQRLLTGVGIAFPHIGVFSTQQEREFIALLPDGRYFLIPPRLTLTIYSTPSIPGGERSLSLIFLREALSHTTKLKIEFIDKWIDRIPHLWLDLLEAGGSVTWPRIGVFEAIRSEDSTELVGYAFTPHQSFAESLNKPFCMFSPIEIPAERIQQGLEIREVKDLEEIHVTRPIKIRLPREGEEPKVEPTPSKAPCTPTEEPKASIPAAPVEASPAPLVEVAVAPEERIPHNPEAGIPDTSREVTVAPQEPALHTPEEPQPAPTTEVCEEPLADTDRESEQTSGGNGEEALPTFEINTAVRSHEMMQATKPVEPPTFEIIPNRSPLGETTEETEAELPVFTITPNGQPEGTSSEACEQEPETFAITPASEHECVCGEASAQEPETFAITPSAEPEVVSSASYAPVSEEPIYTPTPQPEVVSGESYTPASEEPIYTPAPQPEVTSSESYAPVSEEPIYTPAPQPEVVSCESYAPASEEPIYTPTPQPEVASNERYMPAPEVPTATPAPQPIEAKREEPAQEPPLPPTPPAQPAPSLPEEESQQTPPPSDSKPSANRTKEYLTWIAMGAVLVIGVLLIIFFMNNKQKKDASPSRSAAKNAQQMASVEIVPSSMDILPDSLTLPADTLQDVPVDTIPESQPKEEPKAETAQRVINSETTRVQVQAGDRLTVFALKKYGHKAFWVYIYQENKSKIKDPNNLPVGITIVLSPAKKYEINPRDTNSINKALELQHSLRKE